MKNAIYSFAPIIRDSPRILILGTMPSVKSLEASEYYAHPQNAFWKIIASFANENTLQRYDEKIALVNKLKFALWDVCASCVREGSLDSAIREEIPNEIPILLNNNPTIRAIFFNGQSSEKLFRKHFSNINFVEFYTLPSTSAANTLSFEKKRVYWHQQLSRFLLN